MSSRAFDIQGMGGKKLGPDNVFMRGMLWLLAHRPLFAPHRDLISEGAYLRVRGGQKWPWTTDTSFRHMHDLTHEDNRGCWDAPLGFLWVVVAWLLVLTGSGLTARGAVMAHLPHIAFSALAVVPVLLATARVSRARFLAKAAMVRRAFENERSARQASSRPLQEEDRTAIVAHHLVLAYFEEVLETCVYGSAAPELELLQGSGCDISVAERKAVANPALDSRSHSFQQTRARDTGELSKGGESAAGGDAVPSVAPVLMSAARGLRGTTRGALKNEGLSYFVCGAPASAWGGLPAFLAASRLQNISRFCERSVDVALFKYGWQHDKDLRQAAVMKAESKLRGPASPGRHWLCCVLVVVLCNVALLGAVVALVTAVATWQASVPAFTVAVLVWIAGVVLLNKKLPIWKVVDGVARSAKRRVDAGTVHDDVSASTDVAIRALDMSMRAFDDRGELQSCSYWSQLVPTENMSGAVVHVSGGLCEKAGGETRDLYGNISGPTSGALSGFSNGFTSDRSSWRALPDLDRHTNFPSDWLMLPACRPSRALVTKKTEASEAAQRGAFSARAAGEVPVTGSAVSSNGSQSAFAQEITVMGRDHTAMESLGAAEGEGSMEEDTYVGISHRGPPEATHALRKGWAAGPSASTPFRATGSTSNSTGQSVESQEAVQAMHAQHVLRAARSGSSCSVSPPRCAVGADSFAFEVRGSQGARSIAQSSGATHSSPPPSSTGVSSTTSQGTAHGTAALQLPAHPRTPPARACKPPRAPLDAATQLVSKARTMHGGDGDALNDRAGMAPMPHEAAAELHAQELDAGDMHSDSSSSNVSTTAVLGPAAKEIRSEDLSMLDAAQISARSLRASHGESAGGAMSLSSKGRCSKDSQRSGSHTLPNAANRDVSSFMSDAACKESSFFLNLPSPLLPAPSKEEQQEGPSSHHGSQNTLDADLPSAATSSRPGNEAQAPLTVLGSSQSSPAAASEGGTSSNVSWPAQPRHVVSAGLNITPAQATHAVAGGLLITPSASSGGQVLQPASDHRPTFLDIQNAQSELDEDHVGQEVANDAWEIVQTLPASTTTLQPHVAPSSYGDVMTCCGFMSDSAVSQLPSPECSSTAHSVEASGTQPRAVTEPSSGQGGVFRPSAAALPARMQNMHVSHAQRRLQLEKMFSQG